MSVIYLICAGMLGIAALCSVLRIAFGPTTFDRAVAVDLTTSVAIGVCALIIIWWQREDLLAMMIVFALTGFFSSVTVSRFGKNQAREAKDEGGAGNE